MTSSSPPLGSRYPVGFCSEFCVFCWISSPFSERCSPRSTRSDRFHHARTALTPRCLLMLALLGLKQQMFGSLVGPNLSGAKIEYSPLVLLLTVLARSSRRSWGIAGPARCTDEHHCRLILDENERTRPVSHHDGQRRGRRMTGKRPQARGSHFVDGVSQRVQHPRGSFRSSSGERESCERCPRERRPSRGERPCPPTH